MRHRTPSNSAPLQLARRVHKRLLVRQAAEHVEDNVQARRLLGAALRRQGFEVEACDGVELLEHISSSADEYRLAVDGIVVRNWGRPG